MKGEQCGLLMRVAARRGDGKRYIARADES
jgi:hypothetical protein